MSKQTVVNKAEKITEQDKLRAAYALNMCTVSVSQIVDYNDAYVLEQEYEAILNNLNIEQIPKDDNLLRILVELLNTITFFRIQEIKKEQIEKKYQEEMKNAIWSAVPNLGVIVTSGDPIAIGVSLATQVGAGYMNYRKKLSQNKNARSDAEIELQIAAIEQFNSLKRELFSAAWKLAERYNFADKLRLTERQIKQYNDILIDGDDEKRYARLEAIQEKFEAYPPFWYFFGHTAMSIAEETEDSAIKAEYYKKAKDHFSHYENMNKFNILREDQLTCSFALEFVDLLMLEESRDDERIKKLIKTAIDKAGNSLDVLQLCAVECLRVGDRDSASKLLKQLVNEDYNKIVNVQLLSCIYVQQKNNVEYAILAKRVPSMYLFPQPKNNSESEAELTIRFENTQRELLKEKYKIALCETVNKYSESMIRQISVFDLEEKYEEDFFENTDRAKRSRKAKAINLFQDIEKKPYYLERLSNINISVLYANLIDDMMQKVLRESMFTDYDLQEDVISLAIASMYSKKDEINRLQTAINGNSDDFGIQEYDKLQEMGIEVFVRKSFERLYQHVCTIIEQSTGEKLMSIDGTLFKYCTGLDIPIPEITVGNSKTLENEIEIPHINVNVFGGEAVVAMRANSLKKEMVSFVKKYMKDIHTDKVSVMYGEETDKNLSEYFSSPIFIKYPTLQPNAIMVIKQISDKYDLIFTTEGIVYLYKNKVKKKVPYGKITIEGNEFNLWGKKIGVTNISAASLYRVIKGLAAKYTFSETDNIEYVGKTLSSKDIKRWFEENDVCHVIGSIKSIALPKSKLIKELDLCVPDIIDDDHCIYLIVHDPNSKLLLDWHIVEFEEIEPKFKEMLDGLPDGVIVLE